ncbi:MAG: DUF763 domain-containing protein [Nitrospinota bacterium]
MKTGIANLPLHYGKAPRWLFSRMTRLSREIILIICQEYGADEVLRRLSDPFWFQAFGCVLGFDWHSSGVTTTACGAIKEGIRGIEKEIGFYAAGGKGGVSRKTPSEIEKAGEDLSTEPSLLIYASRMAAKVDSSAVQDGYQLYHHSFFFTKDGKWCVVQQGMNEVNRYARRYHWLGEKVADFVNEPESAICCDYKVSSVLNLVAAESKSAREAATMISQERPEKLVLEIKKMKELSLPLHHQIHVNSINPDRLYKIFLTTYERGPANFESLLGIEGVGPKTIRALSLISELIYGVKPSFDDPVRYSFAHGGKDGHPYPVDRKNYDKSIEFLRRALSFAKIGNTEKLEAIKRLNAL